MSGNVTIAPQKIQGSDRHAQAPLTNTRSHGPSSNRLTQGDDELYYLISIIARSVNTGDPVTHADAA